MEFIEKPRVCQAGSCFPSMRDASDIDRFTIVCYSLSALSYLTWVERFKVHSSQLECPNWSLTIELRVYRVDFHVQPNG